MTRNEEKTRPNNMSKQRQLRPQTTDLVIRKDHTVQLPAKIFAQSDMDMSFTAMHPGSMFDRTKQSFDNTGYGSVIAKSKVNPIKKNRTKKSISSEKSYIRLRNKMLQKLEESKNNDILNNSSKTFYWSPDLSF
jgi:hypothetical protein